MRFTSVNTSPNPKRIAVLPKTEFDIERLEDLSLSVYQGIPERLEVLEIIMVKQGQVKLACDTGTFQLQSRSTYVLVPGQVRCLLHDTGVTGYVIRIAPDFVHQIHDQFDISFMIRLALIQDQLLSVENMQNLSDMEFL